MNQEYVARTTHHCMVRIHGNYYTVVHIGSYSPDGEYRAAKEGFIFECLGPNGLFLTDMSDTVENAFRAAWEAIVAHSE